MITAVISLGLILFVAQLQAFPPCQLERFSASDWETEFLIPKSKTLELEPQFKQGPMFFNLGREMGAGVNSSSFSNYLPFALVSADVNAKHRAEFDSDGPPSFASVLKQMKKPEPISSRYSLTNVALCCRNIVIFPIEVMNVYTTAMETGPWVPRVLQLHKRPNVSYFNSYLSSDSDAPTLSPLGQQFATRMPGKTFLDLASGDRKRAVAHRAVAQKFGATDYVGVDLNNSPSRKTWRGEFPELSTDSDFTSRYFKDDILTFLRRLKRPGPLFIRIEGLEAYQQGHGDPAHEYLQKVMAQIQNVTQPGDVLSVGTVVSFIQPFARDPGTYGSETIDPRNYGFRLAEGSIPEKDGRKSGKERLWIKQ